MKRMLWGLLLGLLLPGLVGCASAPEVVEPPLVVPELPLEVAPPVPQAEPAEESAPAEPAVPIGTGLRAAEDIYDYSSDGVGMIREYVRAGDPDYAQYLDFMRGYEAPPLTVEDWPDARARDDLAKRALDWALSPDGRFFVVAAYWHETKPADTAAELHGFDLTLDRPIRQIMGHPLMMDVVEPMRLNRCAFFSDRELLLYSTDTVAEELDFLLYLFSTQEDG